VTYRYKSAKTRMLKKLRASRAAKVKAGWSRKTSPGFIAKDITDVSLAQVWVNDIQICVKTPAFGLIWKTRQFNLRETEEIIKFLERK